MFAILRRRRAGLGTLVLAWFALASASFGAAPCLAMAQSGSPPAQHAAAPPSATGHHHSPAMAHDHAATQATPDATPQPSNPCVHCPPSTAMAHDGTTSSHGLCAAADDAADGAKPTVPPVALKSLHAVPILEVLPFDHGPRLVLDQHRLLRAPATSIALNLRHCVFLI
jgi:hypothetical protein